jgi:hypothetical protein
VVVALIWGNALAPALPRALGGTSPNTFHIRVALSGYRSSHPLTTREMPALIPVQPGVPRPADYALGRVEAGADVGGLLGCWAVTGRFGCWRRTVSGDDSRWMSESLCPLRMNLRRRITQAAAKG